MKEYNKTNIPLAKKLRKNMTPWERKLWYDFLRNYPVKFQRQKCIGEFIVDFYCAKARLVIELDGGQHYFNVYKTKDFIRTEKLEKENLTVIRIPNNEIDNNFYGVCEYIDNEVKGSVQQSAGLYFHIPFCKNKCPYCDFYSVKYDEQVCREYVDLVLNEIKKYNGSFDTIYFGGGTPSIIPPELIGEIISASREQFDIADDCEITIECNPSKDLSNDFKLYKSYGVNRISLGMQSAVDEERFALGRVAGQKEVARAVNDAKNVGIDNISLDLMLATPKQTMASLDKTFDFIDQMNVQHISAYLLKIEKGTRFYDIADRLALPDDDTACDMYLKTVSTLAELGFNQYEISNFAKNGFQSRHNTKYWKLVPYLGIGKSAHSFWNGRRFYYDNNFNRIDDGAGGDTKERIMLGLRLNEGINKNLVKKDYSQFIKMGLMKENDTNIFLTPDGMLVSNLIINEII